MTTLTAPSAVDFALTPEQRAVQEAARDFARREVDPVVEEHDAAGTYPRAVMAKAGELGFLGVIFPEEYGGAGLGYVEYVLVITELSADRKSTRLNSSHGYISYAVFCLKKKKKKKKQINN